MTWTSETVAQLRDQLEEAGFAIVPVEPTPEMLSKGARYTDSWINQARNCWTEMMAEGPGGKEFELLLAGVLGAGSAPVAAAVQGEAELLDDAYTAMLWLYRRLPKAYQSVPNINATIKAVARAIGSDPSEFLAERGEHAPAQPPADAAPVDAKPVGTMGVFTGAHDVIWEHGCIPTVGAKLYTAQPSLEQGDALRRLTSMVGELLEPASKGSNNFPTDWAISGLEKMLAEREQGDALSQQATACLQDVIAHYSDFLAACHYRREACLKDGDADNAAYWAHQSSVLARMKQQAEAALAQRAASVDEKPVAIEPQGWRAFIENIATPRSEPLNSVCAYRDKESRSVKMGELRRAAQELLSDPPAPHVERDAALATHTINDLAKQYGHIPDMLPGQRPHVNFTIPELHAFVAAVIAAQPGEKGTGNV